MSKSDFGSSTLLLATFISNELEATIPAMYLSTPGSLQISVTNGSTTSSPWNVPVYTLNPPNITRLSPTLVLPGTMATLEFTGSDLIGSVLVINSTAFNVQSVSGTDYDLKFVVSIGTNATPGPQVVTLSKPNIGSATATIQVEVVDTGHWQTLSISNVPGRVDQSLMTLLDGRVLISGGTDSNGVSAAAGIIDFANSAWTNVAPMNIARSGHHSILLGDGRVMVFGGGSNSVEIYDPATNVWAPAGPVLNTSATPILLPTGKVLLLPDEVYDPSTQTTTNFGFAPSASSTFPPQITGVLQSDGTIFLEWLGPATGTIGQPDITFPMVMYDPVAGSTRVVSPPLTLNSAFSSSFAAVPILLSDGSIFVSASGRNSSTNLPVDHFVYNPPTTQYISVPENSQNSETIPFLGVPTVLPTGKVLVLETPSQCGGGCTYPSPNVGPVIF